MTTGRGFHEELAIFFPPRTLKESFKETNIADHILFSDQNSRMTIRVEQNFVTAIRQPGFVDVQILILPAQVAPQENRIQDAPPSTPPRPLNLLFLRLTVRVKSKRAFDPGGPKFQRVQGKYRLRFYQPISTRAEPRPVRSPSGVPSAFLADSSPINESSGRHGFTVAGSSAWSSTSVRKKDSLSIFSKLLGTVWYAIRGRI